MTHSIENKRDRQNKLKELILRLHEGESEEVIKKEFAKHFQQISPLEISVMERRLMKEEGLSVEEIMRLCNIHVAVMANYVDTDLEIPDDFSQPGHPVHVLREENFAIEANLMRIRNLLDVYLAETEIDEEIKKGLAIQIEKLWEFDRHYQRKENSIFPLMEKYDILAPPKVMWGVDDEIRDLYKEFKQHFEEGERSRLEAQFTELEYEMQEMFVKEEEIMIPMIADVFTMDDWVKVRDESDAFGYCLVEPLATWAPKKEPVEKEEVENVPGEISLGTGSLTMKELDLMLNLLPLELTFVDKDDVVKYFNNQEQEKLLARTPNAIGRDVMNCHPPKSYPIVKQLIEDLKSGKKDREIAWFEKDGHSIHITYVAVRDEQGEYLGILEYVQDISSFLAIEGEKRVKYEREEE